METIKVEWVENATTKNGKPYKKLTVKDPSGKTYDVNIFSSFLDFANIGPGSTINGRVIKDGKFWTIVTEAYQAPRTPYTPRPKTDPITMAMNRKENGIEKTMDRKEESIRLAGAQRDAVLVVTQMNIAEWENEDIKREIVKWRDYFLSDNFSPVKNEHPAYQALEDSPF